MAGEDIGERQEADHVELCVSGEGGLHPKHNRMTFTAVVRCQPVIRYISLFCHLFFSLLTHTSGCRAPSRLEWKSLYLHLFKNV